LRLNAVVAASRNLKTSCVSFVPISEEIAGAILNNQNDLAPYYGATQGFDDTEPQGFSTADIIWAVGIWSVILTLSPVIVFYMLMVA
jgi:hypothetical protein